MTSTTPFKTAAIDWLLANGECRDDTRRAIQRLAETGVDYERSDVPTFDLVYVTDGDSFTEGTRAEAVAATIYPLGADPSDWRAGMQFFIPPSDWNNLVLGAIIRGVCADEDEGTRSWQHRFSGVRGMRGRG